MKYNLGIDLDGVVCDIYPEAFSNLKAMYPSKVKDDNTNIWNSKWEEFYGLTEQEVMNCFIEVGRKGLLRTAPIYSGAKEALYKINRKYNIYFVSWRNYIPNAREDTFYWLDSNKIPYERLVMTNNKYKVAIKEKFCFFLDDNIQQCNRLAKTMIPTYLFRRPWNEREIPGTDAMVKCIENWKQVGRLLNGERY